jgi:nitrilase
LSQSDSEIVSLLACQVSVPVTDNVAQRDAHVDRLIATISEKLRSCSADLIVLPELCTIDYSRSSFNALSSLGESLDGRTVQSMSRLAVQTNSTVVFGMPRRDQKTYFISQITIGPDGNLIGCYDKLHICQYGASMEKEYFEAGRSTTVFEVSGFLFAPIICYDIRIPELSRTLALTHNVDCILHCGAYFRDESFATWHAFVTTRAMENQLYMLSLNRAGAQYGASVFCPPWVDETHPAEQFDQHAEDLKLLQLTRQTIVSVREQYTFLEDRLPDYAALK